VPDSRASGTLRSHSPRMRRSAWREKSAASRTEKAGAFVDDGVPIDKTVTQAPATRTDVGRWRSTAGSRPAISVD
jgi:hypothetical protein